jgi:hypothetical protein
MIAVPIWIPQTAMFLGLVVLSVALFDELVAVCKGCVPSYAGKGENLLTAKRKTKSGISVPDKRK